MKHQSFTILILPDRGKAGIKWHLTRTKLLVLACFIALLFFTLFSFSVHYFYILNREFESRWLRSENQAYQEQTHNYAQKIALIEQRLHQVNQLEKQLKNLTTLPDQLTPPTGGPTRPFDPYASYELFDSAVLSRLEQKVLDSRLTLLESELNHQIDSLNQLLDRLDEEKVLFQYTPSIWPLVGWVSSDFGMRRDPYTSEYVMHSGLDIAADMGSPIVAPAAGYVTFVGMLGPYGKTVIIDHGFGISTYYGHLSQAYVTVGQEIKRGSRIAAVGNTGRTTGPHLHYEVRQNGIPTNPRYYIIN